MRSLLDITTKTQLCAVIGNPVGHSLSPAIHNAAFAHLELDFVYLACPVEDVKSALAGMRAIRTFRGLSVTIPHKLEVMKHVDEVAEVDRSIGAINTVIHEGDKLIGLGTDGPAALKALIDHGGAPDGRNVLFIGAGGAARAIAFTLARLAKPRQITLLDINESLLRGLQHDLQAGTPVTIQAELLQEKSLAAAMTTADVVVHCTSVGMHPKVDASLVPAALFHPGQVVFDIVYTPLETKLLREARMAGARAIPGIEMFVNQAALQFQHFTGANAPVEVMRQVVLKHLGTCRT
ncbi:MAG: shikimate dehydrogenase [Kiritimatiellia bacterium]